MRNYYVVIIILISLVISSNSGCSEKTDSDGTQELLTESKETGIGGVIRRSEVDVRAVLDHLETADTDSVIHLSLFDDISIFGRLIRKSSVIPGVVSYRYEIDKPDSGMLIISVEGGKISASIDLADTNRLFMIQPVYNTGDHEVIEIDPAKMDILDGGAPQSPGDY